MDTTVTPSEDFYQFVNGGWMEKTEIPADRSSWGSASELIIRTADNMLNIIETEAENNEYSLDTDQGKAVAFFTTAMDTPHIDSLQFGHLQSYIDEILECNTKEDIQLILNKHQPLRCNYLFAVDVDGDYNNSELNTTYLNPGALGLPDRDYYTQTDEESVRLQNEYKGHIAKMLELCGEEEVKSKAELIFDFEKSLAEVMLTKVQRRNSVLLNNPRSREQLRDLAPSIDWASYFQSMNAPAFDTLIITEPKFISALDSIWRGTSAEVLKEYMRWTLLNKYASYLHKDIEDQNFAFYGKVLRGTSEMKPRWERVLNTTNWNIGQAIGKLYVDKHFPPEAKEVAKEMVDNILEAFGERIAKLNWMSDSTKMKAHEKLAHFTVKIGYPDNWKDYSNLKITPAEEGGTYVGNMIAVNTWDYEDEMSRIGQPVDTTEWFLAPQIVNAYYNPSNNEIVFPAGILQPPYYDYKADAAINYGGIGAVIGHEISHGFDDRGSRFDAKGNLSNWWTEKDRERFNERTQQLVEQYSAYEPLPGIHLNGEFTLGENIGDLGGVAVAFDGLQKHWKENGKPDTIQGFTPEQRFFISWATVWRSKIRDEALKTKIKTSPHSPAKYRAIGPLKNLDAFYTAFDIEASDKMYAPDSVRVKIW